MPIKALTVDDDTPSMLCTKCVVNPTVDLSCNHPPKWLM